MPALDLLVVGTGSAASTIAHKCRAAGWTVAVVDKRPYGGTCALRGCDPKKVLVGAAELVEWQRRMSGKGAGDADARIDWRALMAFKQGFVDGVPASREESYRNAGIRTLHGEARFTGPNTMRIGDEEVEARRIALATGARPTPLGIAGEELVKTSDEFLQLPDMPERVAFIGGGYISFEFAHVAARAGASVTILHRSASPLKEFDGDLVARLVEATRDVGIDVRLDTPVERVEQRGKEFVVRAGGEEFRADLVVHGAGRSADIDGLDLTKGNVKRTRRGIEVDAHMRSVSNPAVYAAGDCADSGLQLTPVAGMEGDVAADNMLHGDKRTPDAVGVASVVFTVPPLATVGLTEEEAREQGLRFRVEKGDSTSWYSSRRLNARASMHKVLIEEGSGRILGAHLLGPAAEEVINLFVLAIRHGITAEQLNAARYGYPTRSYDLTYMV